MMPGLAFDVTNDTTGSVSSSTSTLVGDELKIDELDRLAFMAISVTSGKDSSRWRVSSTPPSFDELNPPFVSNHISSPTPLLEVSPGDDISPFGTPPVLLRVGGANSPSAETEPVCFFVHTKLLTRASAFFRSALSSYSNSENHFKNHFDSAPTYSFLEAQTRTIHLPEERPDDVRFFLRWLYHGLSVGIFPEHSSQATTPLGATSSASSRHAAAVTMGTDATCPTSVLNSSFSRPALHSPITTQHLHLRRIYDRERALLPFLAESHHRDATDIVRPKPPPPAFGPLVRLYVFADKYQVGLGLKDLICDLVREVEGESNSVPNCGDVELLWGNSCADEAPAGLKRLVLDLYMGMKTEKLLGQEDGWHAGFLRDLVLGLKRENYFQKLPSQGKAERERKAKLSSTKLGKGDAGRDLDAAKETLVKVGRLIRSRCDYHDHHL